MPFKKTIAFFIGTFWLANGFAQTVFSLDIIETIAQAESQRKKLTEENEITLAFSDNYDLKWANIFIHPFVSNGIAQIDGYVIYTFSRLDSSGTIAFDLSDSIRVSTITQGISPASEIIPFSQRENILTIQFPFTNNLVDTVRINFAGTPVGSGFGSFASQKEGADSSSTIWTLSEPYGARDWFPCKMTLTDKLDSADVIIQTDSLAQTGVSNGVLQNVNSNFFHWHHSYPIATYLIAIAVAKYETIDTVAHTTHGDVPIKCFVYRDKKQEWQNDVHHVVDCMQLFDTLLGEYPFMRDGYGETQFGWGGGMEHQTNSFMANLGFELVAHELAHQWFGDKITCASWQHIWLNEGFATYCSGLAYEHIQPQWWRAYRETYHRRATDIADGSVFVDDTTSVSRIFNSRLSYAKGAYVLHGLRWLLGDSLFFAAINSYLNDETLAYNFAQTSDFQRHCELVSDKDLAYFFDQWIYGKGFPQYALAWSQNGTNLEFQLFQTPSDNSVLFFKMPVPVYVQGKNGSDTTYVLDHTFSGQTFSVSFSESEIDSISLDPELWLISKNNEVWKLTDLNDASELNIYPNPAGNQLSVLINSAKMSEPVISIFDLSGKLILQQKIASSQFNSEINIEQLAQGTYICKLSDGKEFLNAKRFVKR